MITLLNISVSFVLVCRSKTTEIKLDEKGNPPLRKTAINPAFKSSKAKASVLVEKKEQTNKDSESENIKPTEKEESTNIKSDESPKQKPVKQEKQSSLKGKKRLSSQDEEEDSPVKSRPKKQKKRAVIESDSEEETSVVEAEDEKKYTPETEESKSKSPKKESPLKIVKEEKEKNDVSTSPTGKAEKQAKTNPSSPASEKKPKNAFAGFFSPKPGSAKRNEGGSDFEMKVKLSSYHPIDNAFWSRTEPTPFLALAKTLEAIEDTSGRLKTIEILSNYFRSVMQVTPEDLLPSVYMTLGRLAPAWEGVELGIGDSILMKAIGVSCGRSVAQIKADTEKLGDLGLVAEQSRGGQRTMFQPAILTVPKVFSKLREIASITGGSSSSKKVDLIQSMLVACRGSEARYLIRSLAGKLRIGMAEQSVLMALAQATVQTPLHQEYPPEIHTVFKSTDNDKFKEVLKKEDLKLKTAYCQCPSYDLLIPALLKDGMDRVGDTCKLTPGIPLKPMLAHPTKGVQEVLTRFDNCEFTCEWKYDGERAQIHLHEDGTVNIFSRNQENNTSKYPDIISRLPNCLGDCVKSAVLDCEAVAWDRETKQIQPFQVLSTRKRKDAAADDIKVQVCLFAFDILYFNGEALVTKPFKERRDILRNNFVLVENEFQYAKSMDGKTTEEIQEALEDSIKGK